MISEMLKKTNNFLGFVPKYQADALERQIALLETGPVSELKKAKIRIKQLESEMKTKDEFIYNLEMECALKTGLYPWALWQAMQGKAIRRRSWDPWLRVKCTTSGWLVTKKIQGQKGLGWTRYNMNTEDSRSADWEVVKD